MDDRAGEVRNHSFNHIPELDGVRGCAIAMVLLVHFLPDLPQLRVFTRVLSYGWAGVDLFFVLSGFLITRILLRSKHRTEYFGPFYLRRTLRIFPVYYWTLCIVIVIFGAVPALKAVLPQAHDLAFYWFFLSNWTPLLHEINQQCLGPFWSLAVEEQFYWFWPLVVRFVAPHRLTGWALAIFSSALLLRLAYSQSYWFIVRATFCRIDAIMVGALCAIAWSMPAVAAYLTRRIRYLAAAVPVLILCLLAGDRWLGDRFTGTIGLSALDLAFGALLWCALAGPTAIRSFFRWRILGKLGKYSYGVYAYHLPIYFAFIQLNVVPRGWPMFAASLTASISLAVLSYELAEKHILKFKTGIAPGKQSGLREVDRGASEDSPAT